MKYAWIGLAGALGAAARYETGELVGRMAGVAFPWATLAINVTGSFVLGLVAGLGADRGLIPPGWRAPVAIGFLGAFTTFSTWTVDTVNLLEQGHWEAATANVLVSLGLGLPVVWLGLALSRWQPGRS